MAKFDCVCFDLDGTICDSKPGILNGLRYAYKELGEPKQTDEYFLKFIGLSLDKSLAKFTDFSQVKIEETIAVFREYYGEQGIFDGDLYPGIAETIKTIHNSDSKICQIVLFSFTSIDFARFIIVISFFRLFLITFIKLAINWAGIAIISKSISEIISSKFSTIFIFSGSLAFLKK